MSHTIFSVTTGACLICWIGTRTYSRRLDLPDIEGRSIYESRLCLSIRSLVPCFIFLRKKPNNIAFEYCYEL